MENDKDHGIPASIAAAWGLRERPGKGPKPGLSLDRIVEAGVKVAVTEGLAAVSMGRVAKEVGASTMSLYRYVATKDELLALMVDHAAGEPPAAGSAEENWRTRLSNWAWAYRAALQRHPWILLIPITAPPITPNQILWMEAALVAQRGTGLTESEKLSVLLLLSGFVRNEAGLAASIESAFLAAGSSEAELWPSYSRILARLTTPERFPAIHALLADDVFDSPDHPDHEFIFGLDRVLDGIDTLIRMRPPRPPNPGGSGM